MKWLISLTCIAYVLSSYAVHLDRSQDNNNILKTFSKDESWMPHSVRQARRAPSPRKTKQEKKIDKELKLIATLIEKLEDSAGCTSNAGIDIEKNCKNYWVPDSLVRLRTRIASRRNRPPPEATKREKKIHRELLKIGIMLDEMKNQKHYTPGQTKEDEDVTTAELSEEKEGSGTESASAEEEGSGQGEGGTGSDEDGGQVSDCDYSHFEKSHTMLLPPANCKIHKTGLRDGDKEDILRFHNNLRAKVARGEETEGNPGPQPPAADMNELVWNDQLAEVAEAWAKQCVQGHDQPGARKICSRTYHVNQNLHFTYDSIPEDPNWEDAVNSWYIEVKDVPKEFAASFDTIQGVKIGHYTQVVWGDTKEVGCGIVYYEVDETMQNMPPGAFFSHSKIYACNYGPTGNIKTLPMYTEGPPASKCPDAPSKNYPDLCA